MGTKVERVTVLGKPLGRPEMGEPVEEPHALIERRGHVLIVTMNRPAARNALSGPMMELMRQAWDPVDGDPCIRAGVLTGAGRTLLAHACLQATTRGTPAGAFRALEVSVGAHP